MGLTDSEITSRILNKLDKFDEKLDQTCERVTKMETQLDNHFKQLQIDENKKDRNYKVGFAVIGIVFSLYAVIREFVYG